MRPRVQNNGLTLPEALLIIFIVAISAGLIFLRQRAGRHGDEIGPMLNNARQLYIAGFSMATDFSTTGDEHLGWPGELAERKKDPVLTISQYIDRLIAYEYLKKADMQKVMQAPGVVPWDAKRNFDGEQNCPFKIYRVKENDGAAHIFCATRSFKYNDTLDANKMPYGDKGFVIFRKGGDGAVFNNKEMARPTNLSTLGLLPGRTDFQSKTTETADDYLAQK